MLMLLQKTRLKGNGNVDNLPTMITGRSTRPSNKVVPGEPGGTEKGRGGNEASMPKAGAAGLLLADVSRAQTGQDWTLKGRSGRVLGVYR